MEEFWVEYEFIETDKGLRPNLIRTFDQELKAIEFAAGIKDAKIVKIQWMN